MSIEIIPYPSELTDEVSSYSAPATCRFCNSDDITIPIVGIIVCNNCGKHQLFGSRFPYLEISRETIFEYDEEEVLINDNTPVITKEIIIVAYNDANIKYDADNKIAGMYYYYLGLFINSL